MKKVAVYYWMLMRANIFWAISDAAARTAFIEAPHKVWRLTEDTSLLHSHPVVYKHVLKEITFDFFFSLLQSSERVPADTPQSNRVQNAGWEAERFVMKATFELMYKSFPQKQKYNWLIDWLIVGRCKASLNDFKAPHCQLLFSTLWQSITV